eukprot:TRINITY_DN8894_c0_g1_i2.p1 TRINITY_DN8894_c0_g1~~TRINITY_DN8894_c0_g1_i2.p1  ORF type:complete len:3828 (+),score=464.01 TRINITY_DN8894_c0_g1_i2:1141-11484(+)
MLMHERREDQSGNFQRKRNFTSNTREGDWVAAESGRRRPFGKFSTDHPLAGTSIVAIACLMSNLPALQSLRHKYEDDIQPVNGNKGVRVSASIQDKDDVEDWYEDVEAIDLIHDPHVLGFFLNLKVQYSLAQAVRWVTPKENIEEWKKVIGKIAEEKTSWETLSPAEGGLNAIGWACCKGSFSILKTLFEHAKDEAARTLKEPSKAGQHPLFLAIKSEATKEEKEKIVNLLLEKEVSLHNSYALIAAIQEGLDDIVIKLLQHTPRKQASGQALEKEFEQVFETFNGLAPKQAVTKFSTYSILLSEVGGDKKRLELDPIFIVQKAIDEPIEEWLNVLKASSSSWEVRDPYTDDTALTKVVKSNKLELAKVVIEKCCTGDDPLLLACKHNTDTGILRLLLEKSKTNKNIIAGTKSLAYACNLEKEDFIELLIKEDIDVKEVYEECSALQWYLKSENLKKNKELLGLIISVFAKKMPIPLGDIVKNCPSELPTVMEKNTRLHKEQPGWSGAVLSGIAEGDYVSLGNLINHTTDPYRSCTRCPLIACIESWPGSKNDSVSRMLDTLLSKRVPFANLISAISAAVDVRPVNLELLTRLIKQIDNQEKENEEDAQKVKEEVAKVLAKATCDLTSMSLVEKDLCIPSIANLAKHGRLKLVVDIIKYYKKKGKDIESIFNERSTQPGRTKFDTTDRSAYSWMLSIPFSHDKRRTFKTVTRDGVTEYLEGRVEDDEVLRGVGLCQWYQQHGQLEIVPMEKLMAHSSRNLSPGQPALMREDRTASYVKVYLIELFEDPNNDRYWYVTEEGFTGFDCDTIPRAHITKALEKNLVAVAKFADMSNLDAIKEVDDAKIKPKRTCLSDEHGTDVLQLTAERGTKELMKKVREERKELDKDSQKPPDSPWVSAACYAAAAGNFETVKSILEHKDDKDSCCEWNSDLQGRRLGEWASTKEVFEVIATVAGEKTDLKESINFFTFCRNGWPIKYLTKIDPINPDILKNSKHQKELKELKVKLSKHPSTGTTPLMEAAKGCHVALFKSLFLLMDYPNITAFDKQGRSVLTIIASLEREEAVNLLGEFLRLFSGKNPHDRLEFFRHSKALCSALSTPKPNLRIVKLLLRSKDRISHPNECGRGRSALRHLATPGENMDCAIIVIKKLLRWNVKIYNKATQKNEYRRVLYKDDDLERMRVAYVRKKEHTVDREEEPAGGKKEEHVDCPKEEIVDWINLSDVIPGTEQKGVAADGGFLHDDFMHVVHMKWDRVVTFLMNKGVLEGYQKRTLPFVSQDSITEALKWCVEVLGHNPSSTSLEWRTFKALLQGLHDAHTTPTYSPGRSKNTLQEAFEEIFPKDEGLKFITPELYRCTVSNIVKLEGKSKKKSVFLSSIFGKLKLELVKELCKAHSRGLRSLNEKLGDESKGKQSDESASGKAYTQQSKDEQTKSKPVDKLLLFKNLFSNNGELAIAAKYAWSEAVAWILSDGVQPEATSTLKKAIQLVASAIDARIQEIAGCILHVKYQKNQIVPSGGDYVRFMKDCRPKEYSDFTLKPYQEMLAKGEGISLDDAIVDIANKNPFIMAYLSVAYKLLAQNADAGPAELEKLSQIMRLDARFETSQKTLLHIAAFCNNADSVKWLLENPSYAESLGTGILEDASGMTARHYVKSSHMCHSILAARERRAGLLNGFLPPSNQIHLVVALQIDDSWEPKNLLSAFIQPLRMLFRHVYAGPATRNPVIGEEAVVRALDEMDLCGFVIRPHHNDKEERRNGSIYVAISGTAERIRLACERVPSLWTSKDFLSKEEYSVTSHITNRFTWPVDNMILQIAVSTVYKAVLRGRKTAEVFKQEATSTQQRNENWILSGEWLNTTLLVKYPEEIRICLADRLQSDDVKGSYRFNESNDSHVIWYLGGDSRSEKELRYYRRSGRWEILNKSNSVFRLEHQEKGTIPNSSSSWERLDCTKHWTKCSGVDIAIREGLSLGIKSVRVKSLHAQFEEVDGYYETPISNNRCSPNEFKKNEDEYWLVFTGSQRDCEIREGESRTPVLVCKNNTWFQVMNDGSKKPLPHIFIDMDIEYDDRTHWETIDDNNDAVFSLHRDIHHSPHPREMTKRLIDTVQNLDAGVPDKIIIKNCNQISELNGTYTRYRESNDDPLGWFWICEDTETGIYNTLTAEHTREGSSKNTDMALDAPIKIKWYLRNYIKKDDQLEVNSECIQESYTAPWYDPGVWTIDGVKILESSMATFKAHDCKVPEKEAKKQFTRKLNALWAVRQLLRAAGLKENELPFSRIASAMIPINAANRPPTMDQNGCQPPGHKWIEYLKGSEKIAHVFGVHNPTEVENVLKHWRPNFVRPCSIFTYLFSPLKPWHWQPFRSLTEFLFEPNEQKGVKKYDAEKDAIVSRTEFLAEKATGHTKTTADWDSLELLDSAAMVVPLFFEIDNSYYNRDLSKENQFSYLDIFKAEVNRAYHNFSMTQLYRVFLAGTFCLSDSFYDPMAKRKDFDDCLRHKEYFRIIHRFEDWAYIEKRCEHYLVLRNKFTEPESKEPDKEKASSDSNTLKAAADVDYYRADNLETDGTKSLTKGSIVQVEAIHRTGKWVKVKHHEGKAYNVKYWMPLYTPDHLQEVIQPHYMEQCTALERYLGSKIAFYFAFTSMYCSYLLLLFFTGVAFTSVQIMFGFYESEKYVVWNAVVVTIWAARFRECWRRKASELASIWGVRNIESWESPSAAFLKRNSQKPTKPNPITGAMEPVFSEYQRSFRYLISVIVTAVMAAVVIFVNILNVYLRDTYGQDDLESKIGFGVENAVSINILDAIFGEIAKLLDRLENHRTISRSQASAILKNFTFRFINGFAGLLITAIRQPSKVCSCYKFCHSACSLDDPLVKDFGLCKSEGFMDECISSHRLRDLTVQLTTLLVIQSMLSLLFEKVWPYIRLKLHERRSKDFKKKNQRETFPKTVKDFELSPFRDTSEFSLDGHLYTIKIDGPYGNLAKTESRQYGGIWQRCKTKTNYGETFNIFETIDLGCEARQIALSKKGEKPVLFDVNMGPYTLSDKRYAWLDTEHKDKSAWYELIPVLKSDGSIDYSKLEVCDREKKTFQITRIIETRTGKTADSGKISLSSSDRSIRRIPKKASNFRWCYPLSHFKGSVKEPNPLENDTDEKRAYNLVCYGAYVYTSVNENGDCTNVDSLHAGSPFEGEKGLKFKAGESWDDEFTAQLWRDGRFQPVTDKEYYKSGARYYCWLRPGEELQGKKKKKWRVSAAGCFVYLFGKEGEINNEVNIYVPEKPPPENPKNAYFCIQARQSDGRYAIQVETAKTPISEELEFNDYTMMMLQFSYVVCFASVLPLAPFVALLTGTVELHSDLYKFLKLSQRPEAKKASDIGAWLVLLSVIIYISVPINVIVMFNGYGWEAYATEGHEDSKFTAQMFVTTIGIAITLLIRRLISPTAKWVRNYTLRKDYESHREQNSSGGK